MSLQRSLSLPLVLGLLILLAVALLGNLRSARGSDGLHTEDIAGPLTPADLAAALVGGGVSVSNVTYTGADVAAGLFNGGTTGMTPPLGFDLGVILSSGNIANVIGPNVQDDISGSNSTPGDANLDTLSGFTTLDAAVLEFDFVPSTDQVFFRYVFGSDEYNEWVNTPFNDVFAFFINDQNCATVGGDAVSINTINNGNPSGDPTPSHPDLYRNNSTDPGPATIDTEMDGLTTVLACQAPVNANQTNHIKLAIADASDEILDAVVFLEGGSFVGGGPGDSNCDGIFNIVDALEGLRAILDFDQLAACVAAANIKCNDPLDIIDILYLLQILIGIPVTLPPGCPPVEV